MLRLDGRLRCDFPICAVTTPLFSRTLRWHPDYRAQPPSRYSASRQRPVSASGRFMEPGRHRTDAGVAASQRAQPCSACEERARGSVMAIPIARRLTFPRSKLLRTGRVTITLFSLGGSQAREVKWRGVSRQHRRAGSEVRRARANQMAHDLAPIIKEIRAAALRATTVLSTRLTLAPSGPRAVSVSGMGCRLRGC
jgi:hypothetical protein